MECRLEVRCLYSFWWEWLSARGEGRCSERRDGEEVLSVFGARIMRECPLEVGGI